MVTAWWFQTFLIFHFIYGIILTATESWNHGECIGKSSPTGRKIQVGEIL